MENFKNFKRYRIYLLVLLVAGLAFSASLSAGKKKGRVAKKEDFGAVPEITPSVQFDRSLMFQPSMTDMQGKYVLVVFFQEWCPKCNQWSGKMFKDIQKSAEGRNDVILMAVKTDGGGFQAAGKYLEGRLDASKWIIGGDATASWVKLALGKDDLYKYMIVGPDGIIRKTGQAGSFYTSGPDKGKFMPGIILKEMSSAGKSDSILPAEEAYHDTLTLAVRAVNARQYALATKIVARAGRGKDVQESAKKFSEDLDKGLTEKVEALKKIIADSESASPKRFDAFTHLTRISQQMRSSDAGKEAGKIVRELSRDKDIANEKKAQAAYISIHKTAAKMPKIKNNKQIIAALKAMSEKYKDTKFGKMAADENKRIGG